MNAYCILVFNSANVQIYSNVYVAESGEQALMMFLKEENPVIDSGDRIEIV